MLVQGVTRGLESGCIVALLAAIAPGRPSKLPLMLVLVAVDALRKFDFEFRLFARRDVTRFAFDGRVREGEWETGLCVIGNGEDGGIPTLHGVAAFATAAISALGELPLVRIGLVAVSAGVMRNRRFEIAALVTAYARNIDMLALQREVCFGVVEFLGEARLLPGGCGVARVATLLECPLVRVPMAVGAVCELEPGVARLVISAGRVTALAKYVAMLAGERKLGFGMVEILAID